MLPLLVLVLAEVEVDVDVSLEPEVEVELEVEISVDAMETVGTRFVDMMNPASGLGQCVMMTDCQHVGNV